MIRYIRIPFVVLLGILLIVAAVFSPLVFSSIRLAKEAQACQQKFEEVKTFFADSQSLIPSDQWQSWQSRAQKCSAAFYRWNSTYTAYFRYVPFLDDVMTIVFPQWHPLLYTAHTYLPLVSEFMQEYPNIAGIDAAS